MLHFSMATYFVENLDRPVPHSVEYPGVRIDASTETSACNIYAQGPYGAQPGDRLRVVVDGPNYVMFQTVVAGPQTAAPAARPALPANGT